MEKYNCQWSRDLKKQTKKKHFSYLDNDEFALGSTEVSELLSETQGDSGVRGSELALLVQLESWDKQSKHTGVYFTDPGCFIINLMKMTLF